MPILRVLGISAGTTLGYGSESAVRSPAKLRREKSFHGKQSLMTPEKGHFCLTPPRVGQGRTGLFQWPVGSLTETNSLPAFEHPILSSNRFTQTLCTIPHPKRTWAHCPKAPSIIRKPCRQPHAPYAKTNGDPRKLVGGSKSCRLAGTPPTVGDAVDRPMGIDHRCFERIRGRGRRSICPGGLPTGPGGSSSGPLGPSGLGLPHARSFG